MVESADGTSVTLNAITDAYNGTWTLVTVLKRTFVAFNGVADPSAFDAVTLFYSNRTVHYINVAGQCFARTSKGWTQTPDPRVTAPTKPPAGVPAVPSAPPSSWPVVWFDDFMQFDPANTKYGLTLPWDWQGKPVASNGMRFLAGVGSIPGGYGDQQLYCDPSMGINPFSCKNSILTITGRLPSAAEIPKMQGQTYVSGMLNTHPFLKQRYGYFEIKCRLPRGQGAWPAFWLYNALPFPSPKGWEFDIFEFVNAETTTQYCTIHYPVDAQSNTDQAPKHGVGPTLNGHPVSDSGADFHVYGGAWTPAGFTWYYDGKPLQGVPLPPAINGVGFDSIEMYLMLNLGLGGIWPGSVDASTKFPMQLDIDYLKICRMP